MVIRPYVSLCALALCLAACGGKHKSDGDKTDSTAGQALEDQITVDPNLTDHAKRSAAASGKQLHAPAPTTGNARGAITLGDLAKDQAAGRKSKKSAPECDKRFQANPVWASKLPEAFALYPDAQVTESAGNNAAPCRMRLISFSSKQSLKTLIDFYYTQAIHAGFNAEHQLIDGEHILAGAREKDDSAYYLVFNAGKNGGTDVDMIVNHGR